jgi:hypothetical protein
MTARTPLYYDSGNSNTFFTAISGMTSAQIDSHRNLAAYYYSTNPQTTLSVVSSGGNLGNMTDRRYQAGAATSQTAAQGGFASAANTPDISAIDVTTARINQNTAAGGVAANPSYTDELIAFPVYYTTNGIRAMSRTDFYDTFIYPAITNIVSTSTGNDAAGSYFISLSQTVSGASLVSTTPVFTDRRANAAAYTSGGIPETQDQFTTIANYYLHYKTASKPSYTLPMYITSSGDLRQYTTTTWESMIENHIAYATENISGQRIRYSINGTGSNKGSGMADTYLSGSSASGYTQRFVSASDYRTQEFPNGAVATRTTYYLKARKE